MIANSDAQLLNLVFLLVVFTIVFGAASAVSWILGWRPVSVLLLVGAISIELFAVMSGPRSGSPIQRYQMDEYDCFLVSGQPDRLSCVRRE